MFYDAFLPQIASKENMDYVSSLGFAAGYLGGGLLLLINLLMISKPALFHIPDILTATRLTFITVALWWFVFSLPIFKYLREKKEKHEQLNYQGYLREGFARLATIYGPFIFALVGQLTGSSRWGIISVASFFILGIILLSTVDVEKGQIEANYTHAG